LHEKQKTAAKMKSLSFLVIILFLFHTIKSLELAAANLELFPNLDINENITALFAEIGQWAAHDNSPHVI
jgi:hypothetical protein